AHTTNPAGPGIQAAAVAKAAATPAGTSAQTTASTTPQLVSASAVPQALQQLTSSASSPSATSPLSSVQLPTSSLSTAQLTTIVRFLGQSYFGMGITQFFASIAQQLVPGTAGGAGAVGSAPLPGAGLPALGSGLGLGGPVSAGVGQANSIGALSVPPSWAATPSATSVAASGLPGTLGSTASAGSPGGLLRGIPLTGAGRRAAGGFVHRYGFRYSVMPRPPAAG
ncbi:MAG: PE/PPE C-terminal domain-containing protein, partial [Mycobacterium sp.]